MDLTREQAEDILRLFPRRDEIVRASVAAGISKHRIHVLSGISRTTIDKITSHPSPSVPPSS